MDVRFTLVLAAALALGADVTDLAPFRSAPPSIRGASALAAAMARSDRSAGDTEVQSTVHSSKLLKPTSRLLLIRYVDGEFAKAVQSLPGGRKGLKVSVGKPMDMQGLSDSLRLYGIAATQGDTVQITGMEIRSQQIVLQINGGGKKHFHLRQHIQIGIGNMSTPPPPVSGPPEISGATIVLDYGHPVPDMSPDDLKRDLSVLLDFSKQHSATINWVESLPPQFQQAIRDRHAIVGMNQDMVIAAMGRPDHKVRERDAEGNETEDWIYGTPPARTTFVTFSGDSVIRVKDFE